MGATIELATGAEENGLATMIADLVKQNLESKPHKQGDFDALVNPAARGKHGAGSSVAIVADDADVALTMRFGGGKLVIHDGIVGIPDVTIRGPSDTILALSNMPLTTPLSLPIPHPRDEEAKRTVSGVMAAMRAGTFHIYGMIFNLPLLMRLTRVMSVNG
jgi:hypothetical protein